jgi:hypothetical protein
MSKETEGVTSRVQIIKHASVYMNCRFHDQFVPSSQIGVKKHSWFQKLKRTAKCITLINEKDWGYLGGCGGGHISRNILLEVQ